MKKALLDRLVQVPNFPETQYFKEVFPKKQIILHHTVSGPGVTGDLNWWIQTPERVATCVIIARDGIIHQCFSSKHWAHHLGTRAANNTILNKQSIGIEIDNWGALTKTNGKFYSYTGKEIPKQDVVEYPHAFRGNSYYEKYTQEQISSVKLLLEYWCDTYGIPLDYHPDMWGLNALALNGEPGVWGHISFRGDKSDPHPQSELIEMLKHL